jgi:hypothetical protein
MKAREIDREQSRIAKQKLLIFRQQALVAQLHGTGKKRQATTARDKLILMLNHLDTLEALASEARADSG